MYNSLKTIICIFIVTSILFSQRENEHFLSAAQFAIENKIELFLSIYQSGGMSVYGNIHSLKSMSVCQMVYSMLKKKGIVNIGILGSKITGGTFVNVFANDFLFSESPRMQINYSAANV